jgi:hypothetical protein
MLKEEDGARPQRSTPLSICELCHGTLGTQRWSETTLVPHQLQIQITVNKTSSVLQPVEMGFQFYIRLICPHKITHAVYFGLFRNY